MSTELQALGLHTQSTEGHTGRPCDSHLLRGVDPTSEDPVPLLLHKKLTISPKPAFFLKKDKDIFVFHLHILRGL